MHGTGTPLGDPIEVGAALAVVGGAPGKRTPTCLSAVKSVLGHCEPAAGAASIWHMINRCFFDLQGHLAQNVPSVRQGCSEGCAEIKYESAPGLSGAACTMDDSKVKHNRWRVQ